MGVFDHSTRLAPTPIEYTFKVQIKSIPFADSETFHRLSFSFHHLCKRVAWLSVRALNGGEYPLGANRLLKQCNATSVDRAYNAPIIEMLCGCTILIIIISKSSCKVFVALTLHYNYRLPFGNINRYFEKSFLRLHFIYIHY